MVGEYQNPSPEVLMKSSDEIQRHELAWLETVWRRMQSHLESEQHRIYEEIKNYPKPIPACDVQFNFLLEERSSIAAESERCRQTIQDSLRSKEPVQLITEYVRSCQYLDNETKHQILSELKDRSMHLQG